jgi:2-deoxy-D-gluconate 3-dehydrogenase
LTGPGLLDQFRLDGKVAVVTGSSAGLGQAIAVALAEAGAAVVGVATRDSQDTRIQIEAFGGRFHAVQADLSTLEPVPGVIETAVSTFGRLDILVNNAGIIRRQDILDFTEENWDDVVDLNLKTAFFLSQAAARQFVLQGGGGKILNIASMLSFQGGIRVVSYTASKSGLAGITKAMANEWAKHGIQVNALAPGYMATDNTTLLRADPVRYNEILGRIPAGRWGDAADLKGPALFLVSAASDYVTGAVVPVDGGYQAR